jgi:hypothetical protein
MTDSEHKGGTEIPERSEDMSGKSFCSRSAPPIESKLS